jgi:hypothetical protein
VSKTRRNWYLLGGWIGMAMLFAIVKGFADPCGSASEQLKAVRDDRKRMEDRYDFIGLRVNDPKLWQAEESVRKSCPQRP